MAFTKTHSMVALYYKTFVSSSSTGNDFQKFTSVFLLNFD